MLPFLFFFNLFYTDKNSRGGVLEPEGTVEIKYRKKDLVKTMARLDKQYSDMLAKLKSPGKTAHPLWCMLYYTSSSTHYYKDVERKISCHFYKKISTSC